jgi:hypothetical protein
MDSVYAHDATRIEVMLGGALVPGRYTLDVSLADVATEVMSVGAGLPFTVTALEIGEIDAARPASLPEVLQDADVRTTSYLVAAAAAVVVSALTFLAVRHRLSRSSSRTGRRAAGAAPAGRTRRRH